MIKKIRILGIVELCGVALNTISNAVFAISDFSMNF